jgi:hypothetical protein
MQGDLVNTLQIDLIVGFPDKLVGLKRIYQAIEHPLGINSYTSSTHKMFAPYGVEQKKDDTTDDEAQIQLGFWALTTLSHIQKTIEMLGLRDKVEPKPVFGWTVKKHGWQLYIAYLGKDIEDCQCVVSR